ncbi:collagen alpha-1(I) chain-like [Haliaeetus albicilla]|uniref:collagen alpha-1(I) chain-like n=1 Tax=Haliaeetus albicilla TaxID=8969 RepID=UPI0037E94EA9
MRELLLQTERSKRKGEEAPSGCNYLPYLNNAFVMIIIERSLTASTWDLTRPSEKSKLQTGGDRQSCLPGQAGAAGGEPDGPSGDGDGDGPGRAAPAPRPPPRGGTGRREPGRALPARPGPGSRGADPPPGSAGGAYGLMPRRGGGSSNKPTGTAAELYRVAQGGPVQGGAGDLGNPCVVVKSSYGLEQRPLKPLREGESGAASHRQRGGSGPEAARAQSRAEPPGRGAPGPATAPTGREGWGAEPPCLPAPPELPLALRRPFAAARPTEGSRGSPAAARDTRGHRSPQRAQPSRGTARPASLCPEFCAGELAAVEATLAIVVTATLAIVVTVILDATGMDQPWSVSVSVPHCVFPVLKHKIEVQGCKQDDPITSSGFVYESRNGMKVTKGPLADVAGSPGRGPCPPAPITSPQAAQVAPAATGARCGVTADPRTHPPRGCPVRGPLQPAGGRCGVTADMSFPRCPVLGRPRRSLPGAARGRVTAAAPLLPGMLPNAPGTRRPGWGPFPCQHGESRSARGKVSSHPRQGARGTGRTWDLGGRDPAEAVPTGGTAAACGNPPRAAASLKCHRLKLGEFRKESRVTYLKRKVDNIKQSLASSPRSGSGSANQLKSPPAPAGHAGWGRGRGEARRGRRIARSGAGWKARRGAERGAEQILREIGAFTARAERAAARTHAPRFPEWHVGCPADGFPPGGAGAAPQGWGPSGTPGAGLQSRPGVCPPDRNPVQPAEVRGGCGVRFPRSY